MKVYISIPISGHNIETQRAKAAELADKIATLGHQPVNPFDTLEPPAGLTDKERYAYYMGEDIKRLLTCDAILLCDGWVRSKGCRTEYGIARIYGLAEFYLLRSLRRHTRMSR